MKHTSCDKTYPKFELKVPEFLNIGYACTNAHLASAKENTKAMIIEDSTLGVDEITFKELAQKSDKFANFLDSIGLNVRDRILLCLKNCLAYPIAFFGSIKQGGIAVPTSTLLSGTEVRYLARDSGAKAIVISASMLDVLLPYLQNLDDLKYIILVGQKKNIQKIPNMLIYDFDEVLNKANENHKTYNSKSGEPAYLVYTSGTTGFPKGVLHSHRSLIGRQPASQFWFDFKKDDKILHSGKFNWTYVLGSALMDPLYKGHCVVAYEGENDASTWIRLIKKHECTIFIGVPTIYRQILQKTKLDINDCKSLRYCMSAGEHLSSQMVNLWQERFKQDIFEAIGMSEFSYYISHSKYHPIRAGSAGFVQPGHDVKLLNPKTLEEVDTDEEGMICIGIDDPGLFLEYWNLEEDSAKVRHNGYFFTGDYAKKDKDGYIWFIGRKDDIINTFGFRVSPHEVERVIKSHEKVADCVALGFDIDETKTIVAIAVIGKEELSENDERNILEFGARNLAKYKTPKEIFIVKDYPKTKNGKVLRKELIKILKKSTNYIKNLSDIDYRPRRSMLIVPVLNKKNIDKARIVLADGIIFDLDTILQEHKQNARDLLKKNLEENANFGYSEKIVRLNNLDSKELEQDLLAIKNLKIDALLFSCIESKNDVLKAQEILNQINPKLEFMIMIESPLSILNIQEICATSKKLKCLVLGPNKLANKLHISIKKNAKAMFLYMSQVCLAARAYSKIIIDGPHFDLEDEFSCEASTKDAYAFGCDGKLAIHPSQLEYINDIFTPKKEEVQRAKDMIIAYEKALQDDKEVIKFQGDLVDRNTIQLAQRIITLYDRYKEIGKDSF